MHAIKLNIQDDIFDKFMGLLDILPKGSIEIEKLDESLAYPSISFEEAQTKVKNGINNISDGKGRPADEIFQELLAR